MWIMGTKCGIHTPRDGILLLDEEKTGDEIEAYKYYPKVKWQPKTVVGIESAGNWRSSYEARFKFVSGQTQFKGRTDSPNQETSHAYSQLSCIQFVEY